MVLRRTTNPQASNATGGMAALNQAGTGYVAVWLSPTGVSVAVLSQDQIQQAVDGAVNMAISYAQDQPGLVRRDLRAGHELRRGFQSRGRPGW
ncbi:MAG: hypothetical protein P8Y94_01810 [Acidobacteriota bacterium]